MLINTRKGTTIVTQQEKVANETRQQRLCSVRSFLFSGKHHNHIVVCDGQFSFSQRTSQVEPSPFLLDTFSKSPTLPWLINNIPLPGVFLEASLPLQSTFKKVLRPIFIWRGTSRDFVALLAASRPEKLASLAKNLGKLDSR